MNGTNYEVPHCGAFSTLHSHPSWAQIFASGSCFEIPLACIPLLRLQNNLPTYHQGAVYQFYCNSTEIKKSVNPLVKPTGASVITTAVPRSSLRGSEVESMVDRVHIFSGFWRSSGLPNLFSPTLYLYLSNHCIKFHFHAIHKEENGS